MNTPKKDDLFEQSLYQLPTCSICIEYLTENITALACGHCFHLQCIDQHFQYQGTCPNCKKRAGRKEMRSLIFPAVQDTKANSQLRVVLASLNISERKQVEQLLRQIKMESEKVDKLRGQMHQTQKEVQKQSEMITSLRAQLNIKYTEANCLKKQNLELSRHVQGLNQSLIQSQQSEAHLRIKLQGYQKQAKQYRQLKNFQEIMNERSPQITKFKQEMEDSHKPPEQIAQAFFNMLLLKNLDFLRLKQKLKQYPQTVEEKDRQISKLKSIIDQSRRQFKDLNQRRASQRRKHDELKDKYRALVQKAKQQGMNTKQYPQMDDNSNGFQNITTKSQKTEPKVEPILVNATFKKPMFNSASSIGGFKKKDDKPKLFH